jgi:hypothetical protein
MVIIFAFSQPWQNPLYLSIEHLAFSYPCR